MVDSNGQPQLMGELRELLGLKAGETGGAMSPAEIQAWQRDMRACPKVYAVVIRCAGEISVSSLYDTEEAAEIEKEWHNKRSPYFGRAHIEIYNVMTAELAQRR